MVRVGSIRVFGCDTKKRAADYFGPVRHLFEFGQSLTQILWGSGMREIVPKRSIAVFEVREDEGIFAFEMPIKRRLCDFGEGHDLLCAGRADPLCVEEAVGNLQYPCARIGLLARFHKFNFDRDRDVCVDLNGRDRHVCLVVSGMKGSKWLSSHYLLS